MLIQILNQKATGLLHELEELNLIKVIDEKTEHPRQKLSDKYRGVFSKEDAASFDQHVSTMRAEWDNT